jgi:hypothetical protein
MRTRVCIRCGLSKPTKEFVTRYDGRGKPRSHCKDCEVARIREYRRTHPDKVRQWNKQNREVWTDAQRQRETDREKQRYARESQSPEWRAQRNAQARLRRFTLRKRVVQKYGGRCVCCGESNSLLLNIDHVNGDGKYERAFDKGGNIYSGFLSRLDREPVSSRYQILCFNCNIGRHMNDGMCPHQGVSEKWKL